MFVLHRFHLSRRTIDALRSMEPEFGYDGLGEITFYRTYSRKKEDSSQENWADCVIRVTEGTFSIRKDWYLRNHIHWDEAYWQGYARRFAVAMFKMRWLPPGRGMWAMGTDYVYERGSMSLYNCLEKNTQFLTDKGIVKLVDAVDSEIKVLCKDGKWRNATVKAFGKQALKTVILKPFNSSNSNFKLYYEATANHRWLLENGKETTRLRPGHKIKIDSKINFDVDESSQDYIDGFSHGLIAADGAQQTLYRDRFNIRLCGAKNKYKEILESSSEYRTTCTPPSYGGDNVVTLVTARDLKSVPQESHTLQYKKAFLEGLIAGDGHIQEREGHCKRIGFDTQNSVFADWIIKYSGILGYIVVGKSVNNKDTNYGPRKSPLIRLILTNESVVFKVSVIMDYNKFEDVYCVIEPETKSFTLESGVVTGNCSAEYLFSETLDKDIGWGMDCLMNGVGVGYGIKEDDSMKMWEPRGSYDFIIPDTKEGWVESVERKVHAYMAPGRKVPRMIYDLIRGPGEPIKGFGGVSAGPGPLKRYHEEIDTFCHYFLGDMIAYDEINLKSDLSNASGCAVVAGNVRRCLVSSSVVNTDVGLLSIKDVTTNHKVKTLNGYQKVTNTFKQGKQKLVKIRFSNQQTLKCTPNHRVAVLTDMSGNYCWLQAKNLSKDDTILFDHTPSKGEEFNTDWAYFYGVFNGDGNVQDRRKEGAGCSIAIALSNSDEGEEIGSRIRNTLESFGHTVKISKTFGRNYSHLRVHNTKFALDNLKYKTPNEAPVIPEFVYSGSAQVKAAYLAGLCDADGTVKKYNLCSSVYFDFLIEVQRIATALGILTQIFIKPRRVVRGKLQKNENYLYIKGYSSKKLAARLINPFMVKKLPTIEGTKNDCSVPLAIVEEGVGQFITGRQFAKLTAKATTSGERRDAIHKSLVEFEPVFWNKIIPLQVEEVISLEDEEETYDIEVENEHCFFADGILVHNSAEILSSSIKNRKFLDLKNYEIWPYRESIGWMSNNSVDLYDDEDFEMLGEIAERVIKNGEPGYKNLKNFPFGRLKRKDKCRKDKATLVNPCLTGDTKVLTADGRGFVTIKKLADEGKDVNVYCIDGLDELCVRTMRHPRLTGYQAIYRVVFEGGNYIDVTGNHKFMMRDRSFKEASNLLCDDELVVVGVYDSVINYSGKDYPIIEATNIQSNRICEGCRKEFQPKEGFREISSCSPLCSDKIRHNLKAMEGNRKYAASRKFVATFKVSALMLLDKQDVYNGTVDDFHNFIVQGWEDTSSYGYKIERGVVNLNCGEIPLEHRETCNVVETLPTNCYMIEDWYEACEFANFYASTVSLLPTHQPTTNRVVARNRRIGVSIIDISGWIYEQGVNKVTKHMREGYKLIRKQNKQLANEAGVPPSIRVTTIKPGGTGPKLPGKTPGAGNPTFHETLRRIRVGANTPIHPLLVAANIPYEPDRFSLHTDVFEYPIIQGPAPAAEDVSLWEQAMRLVMIQREWADNAVSNTLYFKPKWRLIKQSEVICPECDHVAYIDHLTEEQLHTIVECVKCEMRLRVDSQINEFMSLMENMYGFPKLFYFDDGAFIHNDDHLKIHVKRKGQSITKVKVYEFDPQHEENYIEPVLSMIAPVTKTVSLLPHSAKGAYIQMPEEGITMEEYIARKAAIHPIDWSKYGGSDGIDERFCSGPSCEIVQS